MGHNRKTGQNVSERQQSGPEPERLKLDHEDWEDAVGDALKKPPARLGPKKDEKPSKDCGE